MHLAAASLLKRELYVMAQPLQEADDAFACVWEERVVVTGDEERNPHYNSLAWFVNLLSSSINPWSKKQILRLCATRSAQDDNVNRNLRKSVY
jgi:hypothetical protein